MGGIENGPVTFPAAVPSTTFAVTRPAGTRQVHHRLGSVGQVKLVERFGPSR